jgi:hypothetical protein
MTGPVTTLRPIKNPTRAERMARKLRNRVVTRMAAALHRQLDQTIAEQAQHMLELTLQGAAFRVNVEVALPVAGDPDGPSPPLEIVRG